MKSEIVIQFSMVSGYMTSVYGNPDSWKNDCAEDMIRRYYKDEFASETMEKVSSMDSEQLKKLILDNLEDNPDLGMLFWK